MTDLVKTLSSSKILLDVLMEFEDFLDRNDVYAYKNWFKGEIIAGPEISRYWVKVILKYTYRDMPDPEGAIRLTKNGLKVKYKKEKEEVYFSDIDMNDTTNTNSLGFNQIKDISQTPDAEYETVWLIEILTPKRFFKNIFDKDLEDGVDSEKINAARIDNIDSKTSVNNTTDGGDISL